MESVEIFIKPNCVTNRKQVSVLEKMGVKTVVRDLLAEDWNPSTLHKFLKGTEKADWLNPFAPAVKSEQIDAHCFSEHELLEILCQSPALIRRPLIAIGDNKSIGFEWGFLKQCLPLGDVAVENDITDCSRTDR